MARHEDAPPVSGSDDARSDEGRAAAERADAARRAERNLPDIAPPDDDLETRSHQLADTYLHLGGRRRAVMDDNITDTRKWEPDEPEAEAFWQENIATLSEAERKQVEQHLPSVNED